MPNLHYEFNTNLLNLNNNVLAAIDLIATGNNPKIHSIIQICILPLDADLKPMKHNIVPFFCDLKPSRPENIEIDTHKKHNRANQARICRANQIGLDSYVAADRFEEWFNRFEFKWKKNIQPLAYNWLEKRDFLLEWLGREHFNSYFSPYFRDPVPAANFVNDRLDMQAENLAFPKLYLQYLISQTKTEYVRNCDCLQGCLTIASVYRAMIRKNY